jgi:hypothetical protein
VNLYLVATSTILNLPNRELAEHVLFSKFSMPKKCFGWYLERKRGPKKGKKK